MHPDPRAPNDQSNARTVNRSLTRKAQPRPHFMSKGDGMKSVDEIATEIVAREGGYVNDPDDPGGATKYGVTIGTMKRLGLDLNRDGRVVPPMR